MSIENCKGPFQKNVLPDPDSGIGTEEQDLIKLTREEIEAILKGHQVQPKIVDQEIQNGSEVGRDPDWPEQVEYFSFL